MDAAKLRYNMDDLSRELSPDSRAEELELSEDRRVAIIELLEEINRLESDINELERIAEQSNGEE